MVAVVFTEKMRRPDPGGLERHRVEQRLVGPSAPPVGLVLGPAGSGKTTLLSRVAAHSPARSAWYRAGAEDSDEAALVLHLAHSLGTALVDETVTACGRSGALDELLGALERRPSAPVQLVVDDLHELNGTKAEAALERFLTLRPRRVRMLLGSRRPPNLNIPRLLVSGELGQVDAEDLRFRSWEVEELFRVVYHEPLSPETAAALTRRTGGWAAGLQLFHLATAGFTRLERERAVDELSGRSRLIRSYLARNVLDGLDARRRSFLLHTCTLGVLRDSMCDELLGASGSAAVLAELEQQQFFTSTSDNGATYRYHQVLQTHLEVLLVDEWGPVKARRLYSRSAELLERAGLTASALRAHARAEDWGAVARLLQQTSSVPPTDEPNWMGGVPGLAHDDPGLVVANARRMFRSGRIDAAVDGFRLAASLLDDLDFRARCALEGATAAEWLAAAPAPDVHQAAPQNRGLRLSRELRQLTRSLEEPRRATTGLARGVGLLLAGDRQAALAELRQARFEPDASTWEKLAVRLTALVADFDAPTESSASQLEQIVLAADLDGLPWLSRVARGLQAALALADSPTPAGQTPWRLGPAADLIDECHRQGDSWGSCLLALGLGAGCLAADRRDAAENLLMFAEERADGLAAPVLGVWARRLRSSPPRRRRLEASDRVVEPVTAGPEVRLTCFGRFDLSVDGRPVSWRRLRPRAQSLLMLLALQQGRGVHRESLIADLWPDAALVSGLRSLQVAVSAVRVCLLAAGLTDDCVQRQGDAYALRLPGVAADLEEFETLLKHGTRAETEGDLPRALAHRLAALDLYAGDLLPETGPAEWAVPERDRLRTLAARNGAEAAEVALRLADLPAGLRAARRSLELDPYHDQSWQLLAELFEQSGDHTAASVTRRDHERVCAALGL